MDAAGDGQVSYFDLVDYDLYYGYENASVSAWFTEKVDWLGSSGSSNALFLDNGFPLIVFMDGYENLMLAEAKPFKYNYLPVVSK